MSPFTYEADPDTGLPPLLMVHGLLVDQRIWDPNAALAGQFRRIRVNLPGHGQSPAPAGPDQATPKALVQALDDLRRTLGIARWHLCGQSFGGALVLRYALDFPDQCDRVVFTNANAALRGSYDAAAYDALVAGIRSQGQAALRKTSYHPGFARYFPPDLRAALVTAAEAIDPDAFADLLEGAMPSLSVRDRLPGLRVPAMLVNGVKERKFQPARDWLAQTHPAIRIVDLEGGHSVNVEAAEGFNAALRAFLSPSDAPAKPFLSPAKP